MRPPKLAEVGGLRDGRSLLVVGLGNRTAIPTTRGTTWVSLWPTSCPTLIARGFKVHKKSGADVATGHVGGRSGRGCAKPRCYMNEFRPPAGAVGQFYSVRPRLVWIHD